MTKIKLPNFRPFVFRVFHNSRPAKKVYVALALTAGTVGVPALGLVDAKPIAEANGTNIFQGVRDMPQGKKTNLIMYCVLALLMSVIYTIHALDKSEEYEAAKYIIRRKLRELSVKTPVLKNITDDETIYQIGDLLISQMNKNERQNIVDAARNFVKNSRKAEFLGDKQMEIGAKIVALKQIEDTINTLFELKPELQNLVIQIATGQLLYNPELFAKTQIIEYN